MAEKALEQKALAARQQIRAKMDFFNRLQQFHSQVETLPKSRDAPVQVQRAEVGAEGPDPTSQVEHTLRALQPQLRLVQEQLPAERAAIEAELTALFVQRQSFVTPQDNFFVMEQDRVREK